MFPGAAPELAPYQEEPKQLPSGSLGKDAFLRLGFERRGEKTALIELHRRAPLLVQQALHFDEEMPNLACVPIITTSGGILQGDRYAIEIELQADCRAHVTTQAATRIHEMDTNYAAQTQDIVLNEGAYLEYLPHPIIPYKHSRFITHTRLSVAPSATLLYSEILMPGRKYYRDGELFAFDLFSSTLKAERPDGAALFTEKFIIEPHKSDLRRAGLMGSFDVFGNVLLLAPKQHCETVFSKLEPALDFAGGLVAAASRLPGEAGLIYKILGMESQKVRMKLREFWSLVRREVVGADIPKEFLWA